MDSRAESVRSIAPAVREAAEIFARSGGSCPPGTLARTGKNPNGGVVSMCWRSESFGCIQTHSAPAQWVCPMQSGSAFVRNWRELFMNTALAAPVVIPQRTPVSTTVPNGGVYVRTPTCGASGPCVLCSDANTKCVTLTLCVTHTTPSAFTSSCATNQQVIQTFAFRN